jgi:hypothetical protein
MIDKPPFRPTGGTGIFLLLVLLALVGGLAVWGWSSAPPATPSPTATANPPVPPPSAAPAQPHR